VAIPKIGVTKAPVESLPMNRKQDIDAPHKWGDVAWYNRGPRPGDPGRATIYGHLDSYTGPAVFYHLKDLVKGDRIQVQYSDGRTLTFLVQWTHEYLNKDLPVKFLYGSTQERGLALITCAGIFTKATGYQSKLVVYATLLMPPSPPSK
jgi:sortase (surface protein transpeptidase)